MGLEVRTSGKNTAIRALKVCELISLTDAESPQDPLLDASIHNESSNSVSPT